MSKQYAGTGALKTDITRYYKASQNLCCLNMVVVHEWTAYLLTMTFILPDEHYSRNISYTVNKISTFLLCMLYKVIISRGRRSRDQDRIVVGFTTTCAISTYHH